MQTVLIPTDFNNSALDCIPALCSRFKGEELSVIFIHLFKLSDSEGELLMLSRRTSEFQLVSDEFHARCEEVAKTQTNVKSVRIEFFYGNTMRVFRNFLESNRVNYILNPRNCSFRKIHRYSADPSAFFDKCGLPVINIARLAEPAAAPRRNSALKKAHVLENV